MIINLLYEHILKKYRISIEQYFILECLNLKLYDIINKKRYVLDIQNLFRRKFIDTLSDNENLDIQEYFLTDLGNQVFTNLDVIYRELNPDLLAKVPTGNFDEFWELFPINDKFGNFPKSRLLRVNKAECKRKYLAILAEGKYTHEQIINALKYEIEFNNSASTFKENKYKFMKSSSVWLNQAYYETLLDDMKSNVIEDRDWTSEVI